MGQQPETQIAISTALPEYRHETVSQVTVRYVCAGGETRASCIVQVDARLREAAYARRADAVVGVRYHDAVRDDGRQVILATGRAIRRVAPRATGVNAPAHARPDRGWATKLLTWEIAAIIALIAVVYGMDRQSGRATGPANGAATEVPSDG